MQTKNSTKYYWHFLNEQGAWLDTIISVSAASAWQRFRRNWYGKAIIKRGGEYSGE